MVESRWLRWIGPGVVALVAVGSIASATLGAGVQPWTPSACAGPPGALVAAARDERPADLAALRGTPWFRFDPLLDPGGALRGQRLTFGLDGQRSARVLDLPAESFAAGPYGRIVLAGSDDGASSRLQAIDVASGCAWTIGVERTVIRRATIDPTGATVYETRVDRISRADLGVWQRSIDGVGPARQVLGALAPDGRFGRTFSTEFSWDLAGDRLAVQACGEVACRTRVISPRGGPVTTLDVPDLGPLVGLDGDMAVTYEACRGLPCPIVSTDLRTGTRQSLAPAAGLAVLLSTAAGARLVHEVDASTGRGLRAVPLDGGSTADLGPIPDDLRLHPAAIRADAATRLPSGWVLLAPDGRLPADTTSARPQFRHVPDGSTVPFDEALR
ncbi:MAG: hypothetical protein QOE66_3213 [Chloroflexota bacterium]|nr:hypothetical protein [Chloroflexota bacterium]